MLLGALSFSFIFGWDGLVLEYLLFFLYMYLFGTVLLAPKAREASVGAFYFWGRVGDCDYGVCGDYNATGVQHTEVTDLGASYRHFLTVTVMMMV